MTLKERKIEVARTLYGSLNTERCHPLWRPSNVGLASTNAEMKGLCDKVTGPEKKTETKPLVTKEPPRKKSHKAAWTFAALLLIVSPFFPFFILAGVVIAPIACMAVPFVIAYRFIKRRNNSSC